MTMGSGDLLPAGRLKNRKLVLVGACVAVIAFMVGLSYASVPLYRLFCQVTGFAGTTQIASKAPGAVAAAPITVRFDANVAATMPWRFTPPDPIEVRLGEQRQVTFTAVNLSKKPILGTATFNVAPFETGKYFNKIQCFCFTEQLLLPGERKDFSVLLFVDPAMANDDDAKGVPAITLSYTFYNKGRAALEEYLRNHPLAAHANGGSK
jgi:cytochrome c oxidase assembly protein subunit 11